MNRTSFWYAFALASSALVACSAPLGDAGEHDEPASGSEESELKEKSSNVTFLLPGGACAPGGSCARPLAKAAEVLLDGKPVALGAANRIKTGKHAARVNGIDWAFTTTTKDRTVTLPVARRVCQAQALPNLGKTDFGQTATVTTTACPERATLKGSTAVATLLDGDLAFVPGTYVLPTGGAQAQFVLKEGEARDVVVPLGVVGTVPTVFQTNLTFVEARELPDASKGTITSTCAGDRSYTLPSAMKGLLPLTAVQAPTCTYTLNVGGRTATLSQIAANNLKLYRLDVDDVEVSKEDGTTYNVRGAVDVYFGGVLVTTFATNQGVDLLPGTYEYVVRYATTDGPQVFRETVTF